MEGPNKSGLPEQNTTAEALITQIKEAEDWLEAKKNHADKDQEKQGSMLDAAYNTIMDNKGIDLNQSARDKRKRRSSEITSSTPSSTCSSELFDTPEQFGRSLLDLINKPQQVKEDFKFTLVNDDISIQEFVGLIGCKVTDEALLEEFTDIETAVVVAIYNGTENSIMTFRTEMAALQVTAKTACSLFVAMSKYAKGNK
jgi:hypothetical protein